ncbi:MAG: hypothetical protein IKZ82_02570 [Clostridia bacterium]|nr:hypothetical protein [Clostridia bacterium]
MKNAAAFRITIHVCLFFALTATIPSLALESYLGLYALVGLILLASFLAAHAKSTFLRVLLALIPFAGLLLVPRTAIALVIGALACTYAAAQLISGRFFIEDWRFKREFKGVFFVCAVIFLLFLIITLITYSIATNGKPEIDPSFRLHYECVIFLIAAIVLGFPALRCARAGNIKNTRWQMGNLGFFALPLALALAAGIGLNALVRSIDFKTPLERLAERISSCSTKEYVPAPEITPFPAGHYPAPMQTVPPQDFEEWEYSPEPETYTARPKAPEEKLKFGFLYALGGVLAAALITVLILKGRRIEAGDLIEDDAEHIEDDSLIARIFRNGRRGRKTFGNSDKVRDIYRRYITYLKMNGISPHSGTTSEELSDRSRELLLDEQPDLLLRSLYLRARYEGAELTEDDVLLAEQALTRITSEENRK